MLILDLEVRGQNQNMVYQCLVYSISLEKELIQISELSSHHCPQGVPRQTKFSL